MQLFPLENMLGPLGWAVYVLFAVGCYALMAVLGHGVYEMWTLLKKAVRTTGWRALRFWGPAFAILGAIPPLAALALPAWFFGDYVVHQKPQYMRFGPNECEIVYRFPWLDETIPYNSITRVKLTQAKVKFRRLNQGEGRITIFIITTAGAHVIEQGLSEPASMRAVYEELNRRVAGGPQKPGTHEDR
jgi:hypothetical protein